MDSQESPIERQTDSDGDENSDGQPEDERMLLFGERAITSESDADDEQKGRKRECSHHPE